MHRFTHALKCLILCMIAGPACSLPEGLPAEPPQDLETAWFHDDCAPWDGPATSLYLGREVPEGPLAPAAVPYLHIALYSGRLQAASTQRVRFDIPGNEGDALYCPSADGCQRAASVVIEISQPDPDTLEGRLEVSFEERPPIRGSFRASRLPSWALCG